jgi:hypothetical protein
MDRMTAKLPALFDGVSCTACRAVLASGDPYHLGDRYASDDGRPAGNLSIQELGHQYVYGHDGRYAACALTPRADA